MRTLSLDNLKALLPCPRKYLAIAPCRPMVLGDIYTPDLLQAEVVKVVRGSPARLDALLRYDERLRRGGAVSIIERKVVRHARTAHVCDFCGQAVEADSRYVRYRLLNEDGEPQVAKMHPECDAESDKPEYEDRGVYRDQPRPEVPREHRVRWMHELVPTNWLDPLLTGPRSALPRHAVGGFDAKDVERLLQAVRERIKAEEERRAEL